MRPSAGPSRRNAVEMGFRLVALAFGAGCALIAAVSLSVYLGLIDPASLPLYFTTPSLAGREDILPNVAAHIAVTLGRSEAACLLALAAYLLVVMLGRGTVHRPVQAVALVYQAIPALVSTPLIMLAFHINEATFVAAGAAIVFAGLLATHESSHVRTSDAAAFSRMIGHSRAHRLIWLYAPDTIIGLRPAFSMLWLVLVGVIVVIEFLGANSGLGRAISVMNSYAEVGAIAWSTLALAMVAAAMAVVIVGRRST